MAPMCRSLAAALFACTVLPLARGQEQQKPQEPQVQEKTISIEFAGGTLVEYAKAVQTATQGVNVILMPGSEAVRLGPVVLKDVTARTAFEAARALVIDRERFDCSSRQIAKDSRPVYVIEYTRRQQNVATTVDDNEYLRVFSIKELTDPFGADHVEPVKAETILTAIDTAFAIAGNDKKPLLKYHPDSGLLIANATNRQLGTINDLVESIRIDMKRRREAASPVADLLRQLKEAQLRIKELQDELASLKKK